MLHLGRRVALGVDVADFLELERTFQSHREVVAPAQIQEIGGVLKYLGNLLNLGAELQSLSLLRI